MFLSERQSNGIVYTLPNIFSYLSSCASSKVSLDVPSERFLDLIFFLLYL